MKITLHLKSIGAVFTMSLLTCGGYAHATQYTGNSPACPTATGSVCSVDILDFMKSNFSYSAGGNSYTFDGSSKDSAANQSANSAFVSVPKLMYYDPVQNKQVDMGPWGVNAGFVNHPTQPNIKMFSKGAAPAEGLELFRWGTNPDNSVYVQSEPSGDSAYLFKSFGTTVSAPTVNWNHRGYFWFDKKFDVSSAGGGIWLGPRYNLPALYYDKLDSKSVKTGTENWHLNGANLYTYVNYYPASSATWINEYGGLLPTPLEVVELVLGGLDSSGQPEWWEKYYYARSKLPDGSYNNFGLIKWQNAYPTFGNAAGSPPLKCVNGVPPAQYSNAVCGDFNLIIQYNEPYNIFRRPSAAGYSSVSAYLNSAWAANGAWKNDIKMTKRSVATPTIAPNAPNAANAMPHIRGGFIPPGNGNDAHGDIITGSPNQSGDWVYLENSLSDQDWYIYPAGKDPLYAPSASPVNYCRDGYQYLGSMVVSKSYNGLTGQVEDNGSPHWVILCGTSQDAYLNASSNGEQSCTAGYTNRTWFSNPTHAGLWACTPGNGCADASAKNNVNFCVNNNQCAGGQCNPTPSTYP
ncbi:hypothetical protein [Undibacterium terreum]|uniref:Uncharacterized protein n=1 Tax=Undibacterium terreum TaxID=1224302 RepID=A0A916XNF1_9BURK|nr:hypothetical protein [Undibacterium terreum]GGC87166.1 hypothetical protein GCM10011396_38050 [Undibacterium terreum]